ncbi:phytoene desaturase [Catalinimonas alkaloidigena]|uniref:Phytoene desaturase n=1 Tax=Catalinimonas alkaloidigena TaxID=1075417 RepID=A0A1G9M4V9_9BACT|nr:phytoene desaturase family protein [Catalinimonas alkaloidigena]SDL69246.1 phytoene desaturase [Catalinimonas alkaloidigena]
MHKALVIGAGFAGLSAATCLAQAGWNVTLLEKHPTPGGRARSFAAEGFTFDMGPSWYWMPDVFERYFRRFGKRPSDYYDLIRLDPSYRVVFGPGDAVDLPADRAALKALFESIEKGSGQRLEAFLKEAAYKYHVGINELVYRPSRSVREFADPRLLFDMLRMHIFESFHHHARRYFTHPKLLQLVEFPILFLGAVPENTPALYSLMNYADMALGTWYPRGGMHKIVEGMVQLAQEQGVAFRFGEEVTHIDVRQGRATEVRTATNVYEADVVVAGADYHHVDQHLLAAEHRNYDAGYWDQRTMAPSSLLFYLGLNKKLENVRHHTLFFDAPFGPHARDIYETPRWPDKPLFYLSATSVTDASVAPAGHENLFLLLPLAPDLVDTDAHREQYFTRMMDRLEFHLGQNIRDAIVFKRSYAHRDFKQDYHAFKGNAYGLANTLRQTALLKPSLKNRHVSNLYYTGQLTVPGPGVPPSLISGQVVAQEISREWS